MKKLVIDIRELVKQTNSKQITDEFILHEAFKLYTSNNISKDKKENIKAMNNKEHKAYPKQINYLVYLGYEGKTDILTSKEADRLIKERLGKRNKSY